MDWSKGECFMAYGFGKSKYIRMLAGVLAALCLLMAAPFDLALTARAAGTVLRVGYSDSDGITLDEAGKHSGYAVEYLEKISQYTGWRYEYVYDSWEACMDRLEKGDVDLLVMTHYTEERGERFLFSELPMGYNYTVLYAGMDSGIYYQDRSAFEGCRIGVASGTSFETSLMEYLEELELDCEVVRFRTETVARQALLRGEIDMMAASVYSYYSDLKIADRFRVHPTYIAVGKQDQDLIDQVDEAMQELKLQNRELESELLKTYYNVSKDVSNLYLTREEQLYLDSTGPILIKGADGRKPLGYVAEDGSYQGILVDYLNYLGAMSGLEFVYAPMESLSLQEHAAAMAETPYGVFFSEADLDALGLEETLCESDGLFSIALAYIKRQGEQVSKYGVHTFAVHSSLAYVGELLLGTNQKSEVLYFDDSTDCMNAVLNGQADVAIVNEYTAAYLMQKPVFADNLSRMAGSGAFTNDLRLYVPEEHRHLVSILNKTLEHISEKQRLYMVSNFNLSHSYHYQAEDMLYEYGTLIWVSAVSTIVIFVLGVLLYIRVHHSRQQKKETEALQLRLQIDELTGVYNRAFFFEKAREMIARSGEELGIVRLNVCRFKVINELYGSEKGDQLLCEIGRHLKALGEEHGFIVGRFNADRFYLCIGKDAFLKIDFSKRVSVSWLGMDVALSYGVYPVTLQGDIPVSAMCDRADLAIASNDQAVSEYIHFYSDAFYQQLLFQQEIEQEMEKALAERQFCIYIQPKYAVETEEIVGGEALVRWRHPQKGMIPPGDFIAVFEKNGFIQNLDYYVWEESCRFLAESRANGLPVYPVSVNVSRIHFYSMDLKDKLLELLERYQIRAEELELEITESLCAEEPEMIFEQCEQLRALGFKVAMDDFGSGYSSLNMLKRMPLDIIKMDLKFLSNDEDAEQVEKGRNILRTQIQLAHTLGLEVVVEGLETKEQKEFIRDVGNCVAQGYYYSRPVDTESYEAMLKERPGIRGRRIRQKRSVIK